jgi:CDP-diacylglycerol--serine O-phosphatidyltransferase
MKPTLVPTSDKTPREQLKERLYHGRFVVPNAVTIGSLFCGFLAVIYSTSARFEKASLAIGLAILLDGLDGRVARRLNATSKFGVEFDSFSDLISFGVAPAMLMYEWCFQPQMKADEFGVFVGFVYIVCAASRLARFNISDSDLKGFTGLPTPGAAALVAAVVNFAPAAEPTYGLVAASTVLMLGLAYLMVSKVPFFSIKKLEINTMRIRLRIIVAVLIGLLWYNGKIGFLVVASSYVLSGIVVLAKKRLKR